MEGENTGGSDGGSGVVISVLWEKKEKVKEEKEDVKEEKVAVMMEE